MSNPGYGGVCGGAPVWMGWGPTLCASQQAGDGLVDRVFHAVSAHEGAEGFQVAPGDLAALADGVVAKRFEEVALAGA